MGPAAELGGAVRQFRIIIVCTGNICRSPAAERLLRAELQASAAVGRVAAGFAVTSAGTDAATGQGIYPLTAAELAERGIDAGGHSARQLTASDVNAADLVLTAERRHRVTVADLDPGAVRRTFTLREFARAMDHAAPGDPNGPWGLVAVALAARGQPTVPAQRLPRRARVGLLARRAGAPELAVDDIDDPIGGDARVHARVVGELSVAAARCATALAGAWRT